MLGYSCVWPVWGEADMENGAVVEETKLGADDPACLASDSISRAFAAYKAAIAARRCRTSQQPDLIQQSGLHDVASSTKAQLVTHSRL